MVARWFPMITLRLHFLASKMPPTILALSSLSLLVVGRSDNVGLEGSLRYQCLDRYFTARLWPAQLWCNDGTYSVKLDASIVCCNERCSVALLRRRAQAAQACAIQKVMLNHTLMWHSPVKYDDDQTSAGSRLRSILNNICSCPIQLSLQSKMISPNLQMLGSSY